MIKLRLTSATQACLALASVALPRQVGAEATYVSLAMICSSAAKSQRRENDIGWVFHSWQSTAETCVYTELWNPTAHEKESTSQSRTSRGRRQLLLICLQQNQIYLGVGANEPGIWEKRG